MALPPTAVAEDMPPPALGEAVGADEGMEMPVLLTVLGPPGGPYTLEAGDGEPRTFDTPQALISEGIMGILNPSAMGAEEEFSNATKGGGPKPAMPPMV